jgi:hypothetical protein
VTRYTFRDFRKRRAPFGEWLSGWWYECPWRSLRNVRTLLLEPGMGWLRWAPELFQEPHGWYEPGETYYVAPPLRRLVDRIRYGEDCWPRMDGSGLRYRWPADFIVGPPRKGLIRW